MIYAAADSVSEELHPATPQTVRSFPSLAVRINPLYHDVAFIGSSDGIPKDLSINGIGELPAD